MSNNLTDQIQAFLEYDEAVNLVDPTIRQAVAERLAGHLMNDAAQGAIFRTAGYHSVAHTVLDHWERWQLDHQADELGPVIVRDIRLLADLLDYKVALEHLLIEALTQRRSTERRSV